MYTLEYTGGYEGATVIGEFNHDTPQRDLFDLAQKATDVFDKGAQDEKIEIYNRGNDLLWFDGTRDPFYLVNEMKAILNAAIKS